MYAANVLTFGILKSVTYIFHSWNSNEQIDAQFILLKLRGACSTQLLFEIRLSMGLESAYNQLLLRTDMNEAYIQSE